jgi:hypothetical protein
MNCYSHSSTVSQARRETLRIYFLHLDDDQVADRTYPIRAQLWCSSCLSPLLFNLGESRRQDTYSPHVGEFRRQNPSTKSHIRAAAIWDYSGRQWRGLSCAKGGETTMSSDRVPGTPPNILFILVDELRYPTVFPGDIESPGQFLSRFMPNVHKLWERGVKFGRGCKSFCVNDLR